MEKETQPYLQKLRNRYETIGIGPITREYKLNSLTKVELKDYYLFAGILRSYILLQDGVKEEFWLEYFKKSEPEKLGSVRLEEINTEDLPCGANSSKYKESLHGQIHQVGRNEAILNFYSPNWHDFIRMYFVSLCPVIDKLTIKELKGGERK